MDSGNYQFLKVDNATGDLHPQIELGSSSITNIIDDDTMATATDETISTSESIKAYNDSFHNQTLNTTDSPTFKELELLNTYGDTSLVLKSTENSTISVNARTTTAGSDDASVVLSNFGYYRAFSVWQNSDGNVYIHNFTDNTYGGSPANIYIGTGSSMQPYNDPEHRPTVDVAVPYVTFNGSDEKTYFNQSRPIAFGSGLTSIDEFSDDTTLAGDSSTSLVTEHAVKTYVDNVQQCYSTDTVSFDSSGTIAMDVSVDAFVVGDKVTLVFPETIGLGIGVSHSGSGKFIGTLPTGFSVKTPKSLSILVQDNAAEAFGTVSLYNDDTIVIAPGPGKNNSFTDSAARGFYGFSITYTKA